VEFLTLRRNTMTPQGLNASPDFSDSKRWFLFFSSKNR
jgi:hypothetical protein